MEQATPQRVRATIVGSLPKPDWLAKPGELFPPWRLDGAILEEAYKPEKLPALTKDLVEQNVRIIVAVAGDALIAATKVTRAVPIVSATGGGDFVAMGLIKDWDRPGTNITGLSLVVNRAAVARIEILKRPRLCLESSR